MTKIPQKPLRMSPTQLLGSPPSDSGVFARLLANGHDTMPIALARYILKLGFDSNDQSRMADLAVKNQEARLTESEREELDSYVRAGHMLALLQSKARQTLRSKSRS